MPIYFPLLGTSSIIYIYEVSDFKNTILDDKFSSAENFSLSGDCLDSSALCMENKNDSFCPIWWGRLFHPLYYFFLKFFKTPIYLTKESHLGYVRQSHETAYAKLIKYSCPWVSTGIDPQLHGCSNTLHKRVRCLHMTYTHLPIDLNHL